MALKGNWIDKINGVDENSAEDINQVAHAVIEVEDSVSNIPAVDDTLTVAGAAADAKAVGDRFAAQQEQIDNKQPVGNYALKNEIPEIPVRSVNGKTGAIQLTAEDVGARPSAWTPTAADVGADAAGTADSRVGEHNVSEDAHNDIRLLISGLSSRLNAIANSTDEDLDQLAEIVSYIKNNKTLIDAITTSKVSVSDIVNDLTTNIANRPLSAAQGVVLKGLIDTLQTAVNGKAPTSHASTATTYGTGSGTNYGHVKLSDSITGTSGASGGVAATPAAVKALNDKIPTTTETLAITYEDGTTGTLEVYKK